MRSLIVGLLLASVAIPAAGQDKKFGFGAQGGVGLPIGTFNTYNKTGWMASAIPQYLVRPDVSLQLSFDYYSNDVEVGSAKTNTYGVAIGGGYTKRSPKVTVYPEFGIGVYWVQDEIGSVSNTETEAAINVGTRLAIGRGKVRPTLGVRWFTTLGHRYVSIIPITLGLQF